MLTLETVSVSTLKTLGNLQLPTPPRPNPRIPPLPQAAFHSDISELIICQNEVDLALRNLCTWMKDEPVAKNLVRPLARRDNFRAAQPRPWASH